MIVNDVNKNEGAGAGKYSAREEALMVDEVVCRQVARTSTRSFICLSAGTSQRGCCAVDSCCWYAFPLDELSGLLCGPLSGVEWHAHKLACGTYWDSRSSLWDVAVFEH